MVDQRAWPLVKGVRTTIEFSGTKSSSWEGEKEIMDGMSVVGTCCDVFDFHVRPVRKRNVGARCSMMY